MAVMKTEFKTDPLELQLGDYTRIEDKDPLSQEGRFSDFDLSGMKTELADSSYDDTFRIKLEQDSTVFSFEKYKIEGESYPGVVMKEEIHLDETAGSEVSNEGFTDFQNDGISSRETWNICGVSLQTNTTVSVVEDSTTVGNRACNETMQDKGLNQPNGINKTLSTGNKTLCNSLVRNSNIFKLFKCERCCKLFVDMDSLNAHICLHFRTKPFRCDECGKVFSELGNLNSHLRCHRGDKPFKCNDCGKRFVRSSYMTGHLQSQSSLKPFKCDECGKCFRSSDSLNTHIKIHSVECEECGKCFCCSVQLNRHLLSLSGEKPYKCIECGKLFTRSDRLNEHIRSHTGVKPFECNECGKCFTRLVYLSQHLQKHT